MGNTRIFSGNVTFRPYQEFTAISYYQLKDAKKSINGRYGHCLVSMVFCAFSLEAFLNHLGDSLFQNLWNTRLAPETKLELISKKLGISIDKRIEPFSDFGNIFRYRIDIVHARTLKSTFTTNQVRVDGVPVIPKPQWDTITRIDIAEKFFNNTEKMIAFLLKVSGNLVDKSLSPRTADWSSSG